VPTYACNTSSRLIYLVWIIVKESSRHHLRRAPLPRGSFNSKSRILVLGRDVGERSPRLRARKSGTIRNIDW